MGNDNPVPGLLDAGDGDTVEYVTGEERTIGIDFPAQGAVKLGWVLIALQSH